jgi:TetR/AcrR family transcriptional regulator, tetracycline repressor protein
MSSTGPEPVGNLGSSAETPTRRGPRRSLSRVDVVDAALAVVDEGGPAALSVRAVAARLGVRPNSLYTYVASRAALEGEVVERVLAEADLGLLTSPGRSWRERIVDFAEALRAQLLAHPAVPLLMMTAPMDGAAALAVGEGLIGSLSESGLAVDDAARATYAVIVQVIGAVALEVAETDGVPPLPSESVRIEARRAGLSMLPPEAWPMAAATVEVAARWNSSEQFRWSLGTLLDGIAARTNALPEDTS